MNLDELRKRIDAMDADLVRLLNERTEIALEIGKLKRSRGEEVYVPAREKEVLDCLAQGFLYKEIADKLGISYETVHTYVRRIYEKLQVRTRTEAVAKFLRG